MADNNDNYDDENPYHPAGPNDAALFETYEKAKQRVNSPKFEMIDMGKGQPKAVGPRLYYNNIGDLPWTWDGINKRKRVKVIGTFDPHDIAKRNLQNFLRTKFRSGHGCFTLQDKGIIVKNCMCVAKLVTRIQKEEQEVGTQAVFDNWVPRLREFGWTINEIHANPEDHNSLMAWLEIAHPFHVDGMQNTNVKWMVNLNGEYLHFCLSTVWEFKGITIDRPKTVHFMRKFILSDKSKRSNKGKTAQELPPNYFREVVLVKSNLRRLESWCLDKCTKDGVMSDFSAKTIKEYYKDMKEDGLVLNDADQPMDPKDESRTQNLWRPVTNLIRNWTTGKFQNFLVIAHPNMFQNNLLEENPAVAVVFELKGKTMTTTITHLGDVGTASLLDYKPFLKQLSHDGFQKKKFYESSFPHEEVASEEDRPVVLSTKLGVTKGNALYNVIDYLIPNLSEDDNLAEQVADQLKETTEACFAHIVSSCESLLSAKPGSNITIWSQAELLLSVRKSYDETKNHFAQSPYTIHEDSLERLKAKGIVSYVITIPLTEDGCWLHCFPTGPTGNMVFVPFSTMLLQPITVQHGGGFRTSFNGNRRIQMILHFVPDHFTEHELKAMLSEPLKKTYFHYNEGEITQVEAETYQLNAIDMFKDFVEILGH